MTVTRALLEGSTLELLDVATACGFANQTHFTRMFTRAMGTSPQPGVARGAADQVATSGISGVVQRCAA